MTRESLASPTERGQQRRSALIASARRLLTQNGHHAITLRAVAIEADASHGSVAYYFGGRAALISAVADDICQSIAEALQAIVDTLATRAWDTEHLALLLTAHHADSVTRHRDTGIALYELNLAGARDPELRSALVRWGKQHASIMRPVFLRLGSTEPEADHAFVVNAIGGLLVGQLSIPRRDFERRVLLPGIRRILGSVRTPPGRA